MNKILSMLRSVSLVGFIGILLYVYAGLTEKVAIGFGPHGEVADYITRAQFFYGGLIFVMLANVSIIVLPKLFSKSKNSERANRMLSKVTDWLLIFNICINLIFSISVSVLARINSLGTLQGVNFELYTILVLFLIPFIALFYIIFAKK